jgi:hypothetical protein
MTTVNVSNKTLLEMYRDIFIPSRIVEPLARQMYADHYDVDQYDADQPEKLSSSRMYRSIVREIFSWLATPRMRSFSTPSRKRIKVGIA